MCESLCENVTICGIKCAREVQQSQNFVTICGIKCAREVQQSQNVI